ncbi:MAG TPA: ATP-binding cassette domain-containing protein [Acidobacteriota bacterium]|nr:ATP-binding cassette domain-containing protein [Acidobacteriota bacterium]
MIEFRQVHKYFDDEVVLKDVSFKIPPGETKIILGASGSGKSTILKLILGLIRPESGQILVQDQDITKMSERELVHVRSAIGMIFQEGALFDSLSVRENVGYRLSEEGQLSEEEINSEILKLLGFVGLEDAIDKMPGELSGGMKRRVGIARALVGTPKIVLYDEPTAGLDPITKRAIVELMIKLRDMEGVTSIFVTHDLNAASTIATEQAMADADGTVHIQHAGEAADLLNTRFIMLQNGSVCFEGDYHDLMHSSIPYVKAFIS